MSAFAVPTPFNIDIELNLAAVWKRGLAFAIDCVILFLYVKLLQFILEDNMPENEVARILLILGIYYLPVNLYHFLMETFFNGQSLGKMALGIRVVNYMGNQAGISQYLIRLLFRSTTIGVLIAKMLGSAIEQYGHGSYEVANFSMYGMYFLICFGMCLFYLINKNRQRIGDWLANTLVIENKSQADFHKTIYLEVSDTTYVPVYPEVMRLTDRDINGIRNLLDTKKLTSESQAYMDRIANRIVEVLGIQVKQGQDSWDFLVQLLKDYNYLTSK